MRWLGSQLDGSRGSVGVPKLLMISCSRFCFKAIKSAMLGRKSTIVDVMGVFVTKISPASVFLGDAVHDFCFFLVG